MEFNKKPILKNTQNKSYVIENDKVLWDSRSVAVDTVVVAMDSNVKEPHVLITQRGPGAADNHYLWCVSCGYLDRDETTSEGAIRELWEETCINVRSILQMNKDENNYIVKDFINKEWGVNSLPTNNRQNVSIRYGIYFVMEDFMNRIKLSDENSEPNEIADIKWIPVSDIDKYDYAFNHDRLIKEFVNKYVVNDEWVYFDENNSETFPPEGEDVLVSNGTNYDVAWYILSSSYKWLKCHIELDEVDEFTSFVPIKWKNLN